MGKSKQNDADTISITWHIDDVINQAESMGISLGKFEARTILKTIEKTHDAEIGVNWTVISQAINALKGE